MNLLAKKKMRYFFYNMLKFCYKSSKIYRKFCLFNKSRARLRYFILFIINQLNTFLSSETRFCIIAMEHLPISTFFPVITFKENIAS